MSTMFDSAVNQIAAAANHANRVQDGDYQQNGIWYCGKCNTKKQSTVVIGGKELHPMCQCRCASKAWNLEQKRLLDEKKMMRIQQLRTSGLEKSDTRSMTFSSDLGLNRNQMATARRYVEQWNKMKSECIGLLLWGNKGTGKTFVSACIANALIDQSIPVLMTSMVTLVNSVTGRFSGDRLEYLRDLNRYDLLIFDDFGAEHNSSFALSQVYDMIDQRYTSGKPMIINTNLTLCQMQSPEDIAHGRIYDRILERCVPIEFTGPSIRGENAARKYQLAAKLLTGTK